MAQLDSLAYIAIESITDTTNDIDRANKLEKKIFFNVESANYHLLNKFVSASASLCSLIIYAESTA